MSGPSPLGGQDGLERTHLLEEVSSPDCEKRLQLPERPSRNGRFTIVDVFQQPWTVLRYRSRGSWRSIIRYVGFSILMFVGVSYYFWSLIYNGQGENPPPERVAPEVCESPECIHAASEILYNLDSDYSNIDPCIDFDQYVCGGWRDRHDMRSDQGSLFAGSIMEENAQMQLRHILDKPDVPSSDDSENFGKLKAAYESCLDDATIKERGSQPLEKMIAQLEEIYSTSDASSVKVDDNLTETILYLLESGVLALATPTIAKPDDRDPDSVAIFVEPPEEIGLPAREYYNNTHTVAEYIDVAEQVLGSFVGSPANVKDVVEFETKLANASPDTQTREDITKSYNPRTLKETEELLPELSFSNLIAALAPSGYKTERVIVNSPSYMESLSRILAETSRETVQQFFKWKLVQTFADNIEDPKIQPLRQFTNKLEGKDPQATEERWRKCVQVLDDGLTWSLSRFYVVNVFSRRFKELGDQIIRDIKERFVFTLHQTSWMSSEVKELGIQKVSNIIQKIGYPTKSPNVMDPRGIEKYYEALEVSNRTFFENQLAVAKFDLQREWSNLGKPTDRDEWDMSASTVNAYYNPPGNEIVFPAGIMQPPVFYGPSAPLYLAYGAFGAVSGHELSHAFDSTGRHYDETGNYTNWWDDKTVAAFEERAQCFVDQYSEFTVPGRDGKPLHVNGQLTLGENIADAGGITAAFYAWKKRDDNSPDPVLPGLTTFTKEQLFFVSYANWWCGKSTNEAAEAAIYNDPHAPKRARILGTMANSREFKEAFHCPSRRPVCKLW